MSPVGSPPCIRGGREIANLIQPGQRFTPVHTGRTIWWWWTNATPTVHPRAYGEDGLHCLQLCLVLGSPPCVRGRLPGGQADATILRFTPVRTGKTVVGGYLLTPLPVHPRAYGEDRNSCWRCRNTGGSPPCVRGRPGAIIPSRLHFRFTPVRTGKTRTSCSPGGR